MKIETERIVLRPFRPDDIDPLAELLANPDFMRFSLGPYDRAKTAIFLNRILTWQREGVPSLFAVEFKAAPKLLGYCGFHHHQEIEDIEIGYRLHPDYWNRGLISEAARAIRDHAFRDLNLARVVSLIHPENLPSRRIAEKNGMAVENEITFRGFPTLIYALTREQWLADWDQCPNC